MPRKGEPKVVLKGEGEDNDPPPMFVDPSLKKLTKAKLELEVMRLSRELTNARKEHTLVDSRLMTAVVNNHWLNDEMALMKEQHAKAIAVHRRAMSLLLDEHAHKPRRLEWTEDGKPINVQMSDTATKVTMNFHEREKAR